MRLNLACSLVPIFCLGIWRTVTAVNLNLFFLVEDSTWRGWRCKAPFVLWFPCCELTCCRTQHKPNVGMTMWMSQLLFFQVQNCCPPPPAVPPVLLSPDTPLVVTTVFILWLGGGSGAHAVIHLLTAVWGYMNVSESGREGRAQWKDEVFLVFGREKNDRGTTLGIYFQAYGTRLSWIHRGSTGIHAHFSFHTELCVIALWVSGVLYSVDSCIKKLTVDEWMNKLLWFSC